MGFQHHPPTPSIEPQISLHIYPISGMFGVSRTNTKRDSAQGPNRALTYNPPIIDAPTGQIIDPEMSYVSSSSPHAPWRGHYDV